MARHTDETYNNLVAGLTEEEIQFVTGQYKKYSLLWTALSLIPFVNLVTAGIAILGRNTYAVLKSKGRKQHASMIINSFLALYSLIIFPLIVMKIIQFDEKRSGKLGNALFGLNEKNKK